MKIHANTIVIAIALLGAAIPAAALAQGTRLSQEQFIEGLRREGMSELLLHLVEREDLDPVEARKIQISQFQLQAQDAKLSQEARIEAMNNALNAQRQLITANFDHPQRPMWQTDLGEMLLWDYPNVAAPRAMEFYEFGVPTPAQREIFQSAVPEAFEALTSADDRFFRLPSELISQPALRAQLENTGVLDRLQNEYARKRVPFFLSYAAYYTSLLPDSTRYFETLGANPAVSSALQKKNPGEERTRLRHLAVERLEPLLTDSSIPPPVALQARSIMGRAQLAVGDLAKATENLNRVVAEGKRDLVELLSLMGLTRVAAQQNQTIVQQEAMDRVATHPMVASDLGFRVLMADLVHRIYLRQVEAAPAEQKAALTGQAYAVYEKLLEDPSLEADVRQSLRATLNSRWAQSIPPDADVTGLPAMVVMAMAEGRRGSGQNLVIDSQNAAEDQAPALLEQAQPHLTRAQELLREVLSRQDISPAMRAEAMFNLGLTIYYSGMDDLVTLYNATRVWVELADQLPDQPLAETAIAEAVRILRAIYSMSPRPQESAERYQRAFEVLSTKFPSSRAADNEYAFYAFAVLEPTGKHQDAVNMFQRVPIGHPTYFDAQREAMLAMLKLYETAPRDQRTSLAQAVVDQTIKLREQAEAAIDAMPDSEQIESLRAAAAYARLTRADMAIDRRNHDEAIRALEGYEEAFASDPVLVRLGMERRIIALAGMGSLDDASRTAIAMMNRDPDAAAPVINNILTQLDKQIDTLRQEESLSTLERQKAELKEAITKASQTAEVFARLLNEWAVKRNYTAAEMVPFQVVLAKSLRLGGKTPQAMALLEKLDPDNTGDIDVIHNMAEALFSQGGDANLQRAMALYVKLINGVKSDANGNYPPLYWNAWMRALQIRDIRGQQAKSIPMLVAQIRARNESLGGDPYKAEMERLERKYK